MEIKCKVCGTINDGETNFCKGCFVKLDIEDPKIVSYNPKENEKSANIIEEVEKTIPWENNVEPLEMAEVNLQPIEENIKPLEIIEASLQPIEEKTEEIFEFKPIEDDYIPGVVLEDSDNSQIISEPTDFKPIDNLINQEVIEDNIVDETLVVENNIVNESNLEEVVSIENVNTNDEIIPSIDNNLIQEDAIVEEIPVELNEEIKLDEQLDNNIQEDTNFPEIETEIKQDESEQLTDIKSEELNNDIEMDIEEDNSIPEVWQIDEKSQNELPEIDMSEFEDKDDWNEEITDDKLENINYLSPTKLFLKFLLNCFVIGIIFGALCIGFRYLLTNIFEIGNKAELVFIVMSSITSIATLLISTDRTFKKGLPLATKINKTTFMILFLVAIPYLLIKLAYNLYIGTTFVTFLILISLTLIILAIFFNYMRSLIRSKHEIKTDDKATLIYGIFSILLVGLTLYGVYMYKEKDYDISFDILLYDSENIKIVEKYIFEVEKSLLKNKTEIEGYAYPDKIENVEFAVIDGESPDGMVLYINENGKVTSGTMVIGTKVYSYDGEKVKAN